jgi:hypothetical protein
VLFVAVIGISAYRTSVSFLRSAFSVKVNTFGNQARVDGNSEAAFEWLDGHAGDDDVVVNEPNVDGSLWMYAQHNVTPLIGLRPVGPLPDRSASEDWDGRRYVVRHIHELGENPRVGQLVRKYRARWIYFDTRRFPLTSHEIRIDEIRRNQRIREVLHRDTVHVFEIRGV